MAAQPKAVVVICALAVLVQGCLYFTAGAAALAVALTLGWCHR